MPRLAAAIAVLLVLALCHACAAQSLRFSGASYAAFAPVRLLVNVAVEETEPCF